MAGRKHLLTEDGNGNVSKIKMDGKNVQRQIAEEKARSRKAYVVDDDELIQWGRAQSTRRPR